MIRKIHGFFLRIKMAAINKVFKVVNDDPDLLIATKLRMTNKIVSRAPKA